MGVIICFNNTFYVSIFLKVEEVLFEYILIRTKTLIFSDSNKFIKIYCIFINSSLVPQMVVLCDVIFLIENKFLISDFLGAKIIPMNATFDSGFHDIFIYTC